MRLRPVLALCAALAVAASLTAAGCSGDSASALEDFTAVSAKPDTSVIDIGDTGASVGDLNVFSAAVTRDGEAFGNLYGLKLAVAAPGLEGAPEGLGLFQNQLTFVFPDGTISIAGVQFYTVDGSIPENSLAEGEYRSIVGGTGAYAGARGVLHTTAQEDGSRVQEFMFQP